VLVARLHAPRDLRVERLPDPVPAEGEVLVGIRACGICGSDLHLYAGHDPWRSAPPGPRCLGHETAGIVTAVGSGITRVAPGDPVAVEPMFLRACGRCRHCLAGASNRCLDRGMWRGRKSGVGGFAEFELAAESNVYPLPPDLDLEVAAFADVYACALHALRRADAQRAATLLVIGPGALGLAVAQTARALGVPRIVVLGRRPETLPAVRAAAGPGTVVVADPKEAAEALGPDGAEAVVEAVGGDGATMAEALRLAARGAAIGILGAFWRAMPVDYAEANAKEITIAFSSAYSQTGADPEFAAALRLLAAGQVDPARLVTHRYPLERIGEAFQIAADKRSSGAIRVMVRP
jgi:threonine dehydrogenase-like Zn-dependent dehydrogenase